MNVKNIPALRAFMMFIYNDHKSWGWLYRSIILPLQDQCSLRNGSYRIYYYPEWGHDDKQELDFVYINTKGEPIEWKYNPTKSIT